MTSAMVGQSPNAFTADRIPALPASTITLRSSAVRASGARRASA
jgi:hypothetical protein